MIGTSHLVISIILMLTSSISIYLSILVYGESNHKVHDKSLYFLFSMLSFVVSMSLVYYTREIKTMESVYWITQFLNANRNTFFVSCFMQLYDSYSILNKFVHTRVIKVHDSLICITIITFFIYVYFTFSFKKVAKIGRLRKFRKAKETPLQAENVNNSVNDNEDISFPINENPFQPTEINSNPPDEIPVQPWVIPQSDDSEIPPPQQTSVLPASDAEDQHNAEAPPTSQPQNNPLMQPVNEYQYEYYSYDE